MTPLVNGTSSQANATVVRGGFQPSEIAAKAETTNQPAEPSTSDTKLYIGTSGTHWFIVSGSNPLATQTANNATGTDSPKETAAPDVTGAPEVMQRVFEIGGVTVIENSQSKLVVGSQTLELGSSIVVGTGASTTPIAIHTEKGATRIVVGTTIGIVPTRAPIQTKNPARQSVADSATTTSLKSAPTAKPTTSIESTTTGSAGKESGTRTTTTVSTIPRTTAAASTATTQKGGAAVLTADDSVPTTTPATSSVAAATYTGAAVSSATINYLKLGAIGILTISLVIFI